MYHFIDVQPPLIFDTIQEDPIASITNKYFLYVLPRIYTYSCIELQRRTSETSILK